MILADFFVARSQDAPKAVDAYTMRYIMTPQHAIYTFELEIHILHEFFDFQPVSSKELKTNVWFANYLVRNLSAYQVHRLIDGGIKCTMD